MAKLIVQIAGGTPVVHELGGDGVVTIGRETDNAICIADASVSRRHAEIVSRDGVRTFRDLDSANGSLVNYEPTTSAALKDGDIVHVGTVQSTFVADPPPQAMVEPKPEAMVSDPTLAKLEPKPRAGAFVSRVTKIEPKPGAIDEPQPEAVIRGSRMTEAEPTPGAATRGPGVAKRWVLIGSAILLTAALALAAVPLFHGSLARGIRRPPEAVITPEQRAKATKAFWDQIQRIEQAGNERGHNVPLNRYPRLAGGLYDFDHLNNDNLESLRENLLRRSQDAVQVATELAALDKSNVDADLLTYTSGLGGQWQSAAEVDAACADLAAAVAEQRLRYMAADASVLKSLGLATEDHHTEQENQATRNRVIKMAADWSAQRSAHLALTTKTLDREKEINQLLTQRYRIEFR